MSEYFAKDKPHYWNLDSPKETKPHENVIYQFWNENYNKAQQTAEPEINPNDLPRDLIKRILKFIHPDKHDNSKEANDLTAEILKYK